MVRLKLVSDDVRTMKVLCPKCNSGRLCDLKIGDDGELEIAKGAKIVIKCPKCKSCILITVC